MEVKILSLSSLFYLTPLFPHYFEESVEKMAGEGTSSEKSMNPYPLRIDVVSSTARTTLVCGGVR